GPDAKRNGLAFEGNPVGRVEGGRAESALSRTRHVRAIGQDHGGNNPPWATASASFATTNHHGGDEMSSVPRPVDLTHVPGVPWAWVDERVYAAIRACSVKVLQRERRLNIGCPFRRINGTSIRYRMGDITAFLESQPGGGGAATPNTESKRGPGRPRKFST